MKTSVTIVLNKDTQRAVESLIDFLHENGYRSKYWEKEFDLLKWWAAIRLRSNDLYEKLLYFNTDILGWDHKTSVLVKAKLANKEVEFYQNMHFSDIPDILNIVVEKDISYHISLIRKEINDSNNS